MEQRPGVGRVSGWINSRICRCCDGRHVGPEEPIAQAGSPLLAVGTLATGNQLETRRVSPMLSIDLDHSATPRLR
jgi:hypothetical protein